MLAEKALPFSRRVINGDDAPAELIDISDLELGPNERTPTDNGGSAHAAEVLPVPSG